MSRLPDDILRETTGGDAPKPAAPGELERLRSSLTLAIQHGTILLADLTSLDNRLHVMLPWLARLPESGREARVARLCGFDPGLADHLRQLVESLADALAGLSTTDGGQGWVELQLARLAAGEEIASDEV